MFLEKENKINGRELSLVVKRRYKELAMRGQGELNLRRQRQSCGDDDAIIRRAAASLL